MTPMQVDYIADHIADFSLSYIQNFRSRAFVPGANGAVRAIEPRVRK